MVKIRNPINNEIKRWIISLFLRMICFCPPASNAFQLLSDLFGGWYNKSHGTGPKKTGELYGEFSRLGDFLALFFIADPQVSDLTKTRRIQWKLGKRPKLGSKKNYIRCFIWCFFGDLNLEIWMFFYYWQLMIFGKKRGISFQIYGFQAFFLREISMEFITLPGHFLFFYPNILVTSTRVYLYISPGQTTQWFCL